jgi:hypothetical protein
LLAYGSALNYECHPIQLASSIGGASAWLNEPAAFGAKRS